MPINDTTSVRVRTMSIRKYSNITPRKILESCARVLKRGGCDKRKALGASSLSLAVPDFCKYAIFKKLRLFFKQGLQSITLQITITNSKDSSSVLRFQVIQRKTLSFEDVCLFLDSLGSQHKTVVPIQETLTTTTPSKLVSGCTQNNEPVQSHCRETRSSSTDSLLMQLFDMFRPHSHVRIRSQQSGRTVFDHVVEVLQKYTVEQVQNAIERIQQCIDDLSQLKPQSVKIISLVKPSCLTEKKLQISKKDFKLVLYIFYTLHKYRSIL